jgi:hypothetical protein
MLAILDYFHISTLSSLTDAFSLQCSQSNSLDPQVNHPAQKECVTPHRQPNRSHDPNTVGRK